MVLPGAPYARDASYPQPALDMRAQPIAFATYGHAQPRYLFFHDLLLFHDLQHEGHIGVGSQGQVASFLGHRLENICCNLLGGEKSLNIQ